MIDYLLELDDKILLLVNGLRTPFLDQFMYIYSSKLVWIPLYASILYLVVRNFSLKTTLFIILAIGLTILFADQIGASVIRPIVERYRPSNLNNPISEYVELVNGYRGGRYGFPSCHAANTFGLVFFILFLFRTRWLSIFLTIWAVITCYSRMYLGVHYLGDLLAGMLLGLLSAYIMYRLLKYAIESTTKEHLQPSTAKHWAIPIYVGIINIAGIAIYAICIS